MRSEGYGSCRVCLSVCLCVCLCVCPLSHISPLELLFVVKTLPYTQRETKVKRVVAFSLKLFRCRDRAVPPLMVIYKVCLSVKSHLTSGASVRCENAAIYSAGNEGQKSCGVFSETVPLQRSSGPSLDGHI